jgi:hypothetical protein
VMFGRAMTGRPWLLVLPAAISTAALVVGSEQLLRLLPPSMTQMRPPTLELAEPTPIWILRRWERIALMEAKLHGLNQEIAQLQSLQELRNQRGLNHLQPAPGP